MEKRNTLLLTVIAVATLLVAVVGATFAYFATTVTNTNVVNVQATTAQAGGIFKTLGNTVELNVPLANMAYNSVGGNVAADNNTTTLNVIYNAGSETALDCTYDIYWKWTSDDIYKAYSNTELSDPDVEFGLKVTGSALTGSNSWSSEKNLTNLGVTAKDVQTTIVSGARISSTNTDVEQDWTIDVAIYNFPNIVQSDGDNSIADKHYSAEIGVYNVVCGLAHE